MLTAISRYGSRLAPEADALIESCRRRGELLRGPELPAFENAFAAHLGGGRAVSTSYGRMAFYYVLKALDLPAGSEIVFPALTFWVVPEMARALGLSPVFADVDPWTFNIDPAALERAITPRTRAVVPTHIYGLPCDLDPVLSIARRHGLRVIEDCAHSLGASYHGRPVGTFGDAAFFSFQLLKPLNTFGGGMAFTRDPGLGQRIASLAFAEPWPAEAEVRSRIRLGRLERRLTRPTAFTLTVFPILWATSFLHVNPDVYLWEKVRSLRPLPPSYRRRYSNVQAALGLAGLERLSEWTDRARAHALFLGASLAGVDGLRVPSEPTDRIHVYYQYCVYVPERDATVQRCLRSGLDVEHHHMDVCSDVPLFGAASAAPGARRTADAIQLPVHSELTPRHLEAVARRFRRAVAASPPRPARAIQALR